MPRTCTPLEQSLAEFADRWNAFAQLLDEIATALSGLPDDTRWSIAGMSGYIIGQVTLADFIHKFENFSWTLTTRDYSSVNGGVGQVVSRIEGHVWQSAAEEIRASDFATYMSWPAREGATYLALHETAHTTALGLQLNNVLHDQFVHMGGDEDRYPSSPQWTYNEATANLIARTVAEAIGFPILPHPTGGFPNVITRKFELA